MNILEKLSAGNSNVEKIRNQLFEVLTVPLYPPTSEVIASEFDIDNGAKFERPNSFGNYKNSGGACLGVLGKDFKATQPKMLLDAFESCLIDTNLDLSTLEYNELQGGKKIRFSINLGRLEFKNNAQVGDVVETNLALQTGYDGFTSTSFQLETKVLKCTNGMVGRGTTTSVSFKNTNGNIGKIAIACNDIAKMQNANKDFAQLIKLYDKTAIDKTTIDNFCKATIGYSAKDRSELGKVKLARLDELQSAIDIELSRNGKTAWGLLNGLTYATNHIWTSEANKLDYLTVGAGLKTNDKAQKFLMELVK